MSLIEMVRCMFAEAKCMSAEIKILKALWKEAVSSASYLQDIIVTGTIGTVPFEKVSNKVLDVSHLTIFGESGFVNIPIVHNSKLSENLVEMIFVAYDRNSAYRMLHADNRIQISRYVKFTDKKKRFYGSQRYTGLACWSYFQGGR